jgi:hypothetical protein
VVPSTTQLVQILVGLGGLGLGQSAMALETVPALPPDSLTLCPSAAKPCAEAPTKAPMAMAASPPKCQENSKKNCQPDAPLQTVGWALPTIDPELAQPPPQLPLAIALTPATAQPATLASDTLAVTPDLDLDPAVIDGSPTLQRWLERIPDIADEIRHQPSFRTRLRAGYAQFPSNAQIGGFGAAVEDVFLVPGTGLSASADYSRSWNGDRQSYGGEARYYLLPLGGYVNIAPTVGYRSLHTPAYQTDGLDVGLRLMLVPSRGGGADLALSQRWVAPGSEGEVGITSLAIGYAVTRQLRLGTDFQLQNSRFGQDSRFGLSLELLL